MSRPDCATPSGSDGGRASVPGVFDPGLQLSGRSAVGLAPPRSGCLLGFAAGLFGRCPTPGEERNRPRFANSAGSFVSIRVVPTQMRKFCFRWSRSEIAPFRIISLDSPPTSRDRHLANGPDPVIGRDNRRKLFDPDDLEILPGRSLSPIPGELDVLRHDDPRIPPGVGKEYKVGQAHPLILESFVCRNGTAEFIRPARRAPTESIPR